MRATGWTALLLLVLAGAAWIATREREAPLPPSVAGTLVFVSDRSGSAALYARRLPRGDERRLTFLSEPVGEPALSHDGRRVAFVMGGRIGIVPVAGGDARFVTTGVDWRDGSPSWRSDDKALVVAARRADGENGDVHLLVLDAGGADATRVPWTSTPVDESSPIFAPADAFVVFVREDNLFRLDKDGRTRRLTGGFKRVRSPRFLPSGRLVCLWSEGKQHGLDVMDFDGKNRETLSQGSVYYRGVAPSPDGRYLAATFTYDLSFHVTDLLRLRQAEEVRLLDAHGEAVGVLARSWLHSSHSADWSP